MIRANAWLRAALVAAALPLPFLAGCDAPQPDPEPVVRPVRYERVLPRDAAEVRTFSGVAQAALESNLSFKVSGTVTDLLVEVGDSVSPQQVIARLDPTDYQVRGQEAEAGLASAQANERNARASYDRTRGLYENRNASRSELDAARAQSESAAAQVRQATQQLEAARLQLSYTRLRAPQECTVAQTPVKTSENVAAGQLVVRVNCGECPEVQVSVPGTVISRVREGDPVSVVIGALEDRQFPATVTEVGVASGNGSSAFPVTVALIEGCDAVRSGMAGDVIFEIGVESSGDELVVPLVAVGEDAAGKFVFVLEPDEGDLWRALRREVTVGALTPGGVAIQQGLSPGELVVTAGVSRIQSNQVVRLLER
ncbi:MAG: efflux RND transporter periplasmic adaptor subunit [Pseudomonadota bacterium]